MGKTSCPVPGLPEFDSTKLGGRSNPSWKDQTSFESKGKQRLPLVETLNSEGISSLDLLEERGAIDTGNSGSISERISPGAHEQGSLLSPSEKSLANRCLATTSRPIGRSVIVLRLKLFA